MTQFIRSLALALCLFTAASAAKVPFDMAATMKVGAWQEREEVTTNDKGKATEANTVWMGVVGREDRAGVPHIWLEARMQGFKLGRKGQRQPKGNPVVMKTLIEEGLLVDFENPLANMRRFGKEIIVQSGNEQAMRMQEGGAMADMALRAFGGKSEFQFEDTGAREDVTVPAGTISTVKWVGSGSYEMNLMIRKVRVDSEVTSWMSEKIPLGVVKQTTRSTTNGKTTMTESVLLSYGDSGATSAIDDASVQDMPSLQIPGLNR